jgi:hypothetical protein
MPPHRLLPPPCRLTAKKENAVETYAKFKKEYLYLKSFLMIASVNHTDIDDIKE